MKKLVNLISFQYFQKQRLLKAFRFGKSLCILIYFIYQNHTLFLFIFFIYFLMYISSIFIIHLIFNIIYIFFFIKLSDACVFNYLNIYNSQNWQTSLPHRCLWSPFRRRTRILGSRFQSS